MTAKEEKAHRSESVLEAREAGLRYITDEERGFSRRRTRTGFSYRDTNGKPIKDEAALKRIRSLVIPPAWEDVWISPLANGHIQATGRDARKRKQYRYHAKWREQRDESKFEHMLEFARVLPKIRR